MKINTERLRQEIRNNLFTQKDFAEQVWFCKIYLSLVLNWRREPWVKFINKVLKILNIKKEDLIIK